MKLFNLTSPIIAGVLCLFIISCQQSPKQIIITNPLNTDRPDELVVLKRADLEKKLGNIAAGKYVTFKKPTGVPFVVQFDDLDGDNKWDEAAFLYSFKPNEQLQLEPAVVDAPATVKAVVRAHVRQMRKNSDNSFGEAVNKDTMPVNAQPTDFSKQALPPYLTEGPAWENDKVGFRIYFDVRNGKDIWGKTTPAMMMDEVGRDTSKSYHKQADWGMDILKVGASLGAGSLALQVPLQNGKDTLVRLGGSNIKQVTYEKIADGPVRAIFKMKYADWKVADNLPPVTVTETISIWGGEYCYQSNVSVTNAPSGSKLVTGIVNLHSNQVHEIDTLGYKSIYTYDAQSENNDKLGLAIIMPGNRNVVTGVTPNANSDIQNTYTIAAPVQNNQSLVFRFYAGWERSEEQFINEGGFKKYITVEMSKWAKPISY